MLLSSAHHKIWKNVVERAVRSASSNSRSTVDSEEIDHFKKLGDDWWQEYGKWRPLHAMNKLRVPFIRDGILSSRISHSISKPLKGINILDVGCGGGILTEPLARLAGTVTGIDPNPSIIEIAKTHAQKGNLNITYECTTIEDFARDNKEQLDAVVASEVIEHVTNKQQFLTACVECLKPGGSIFITTMNKTLAAGFFGIFVAENVLGLVPKGTHQYEKFIGPDEVKKMLQPLDCKTVHTRGMLYNFLTNEWTWLSFECIDYVLHAIKKERNVLVHKKL